MALQCLVLVAPLAPQLTTPPPKPPPHLPFPHRTPVFAVRWSWRPRSRRRRCAAASASELRRWIGDGRFEVFFRFNCTSSGWTAGQRGISHVKTSSAPANQQSAESYLSNLGESKRRHQHGGAQTKSAGCSSKTNSKSTRIRPHRVITCARQLARSH